MPQARVFNLSAHANAGWTALARIRKPDGTAITQADLTAITLNIVNECNEESADETLVITDVIFDVLQTEDPRWKEDLVGYNFRYEVPATGFPSRDWYRAVFTFTPVEGEVFKLVYTGAAESG